MKKKWYKWDDSLVHTIIHPATKAYIRERLNKTEEDQIEIGVIYPITKNLLGVRIEEGVLRLLHIPKKLFLAFLNDLIGVYKVSGVWQCVGTNDVSVVERWIKRFDLEALDKETVEGYAINHELVEWIKDPFSGIEMRYRSANTKLLVLYRLFFLISGNDYYIIIEKLS